jgi:hypothetical protein
MSKIIIILLLIFVISIVVFISSVFAADECRQVFQPNATSTIGEFVLDDNYEPAVGLDCSIVSYDPSNELYIDAAMTEFPNGWYAYTFTASTTGGFYRTLMTCAQNLPSHTIAKDKSFCVNSGNLTASVFTGFTYGEIVSTLFLFLIFLVGCAILWIKLFRQKL